MTTVADLGTEAAELTGDLTEITYLGTELDVLAVLAGVDVGADAAVVAAAPIFLDPIVICLGLVALIIAVGFKWLVAMPLAWLVSHIPFVGGTLASWVNDAGDWEWSTVSGWAHDAMQALWWVLQMFIHLVQLPIVIVRVLGGTVVLAYELAVRWVPYYYGLSITYADSWGHELLNDLAALDARVTTEVFTAYYLSINHANDLYNAAVAYATELYHYSTDYAAALFAKAEADIQTVYTGVVGDIDALEQKVELEIGRAEVQAKDYTDGAVQDAELALDAVIGAGIAGVTALATGIANTLRNFLDDCGNDLCEANNQQAKNSLNLSSLLGDGLLFGFLAAAIRDPKGTADVTEPVLQPFATAAGDVVDALVTQVV